MAVPFGLMATGAAIKIAGQIMSNFSQSATERENEQFYREQAQYAMESARRAEDIAEFEYTTRVGQQISKYASGGVELSGSAALTSAGTIKNMLDEMIAIDKKAAIESKLALLRATQSGERASMLQSPLYNALQISGTALDAMTRSDDFLSWFKPTVADAAINVYASGKIPSQAFRPEP